MTVYPYYEVKNSFSYYGGRCWSINSRYYPKISEPVPNVEISSDSGYGSFQQNGLTIHKLLPYSSGDVVELSVDIPGKTVACSMST